LDVEAEDKREVERGGEGREYTNRYRTRKKDNQNYPLVLIVVTKVKEQALIGCGVDAICALLVR
jgi:hypothetical protein